MWLKYTVLPANMIKIYYMMECVIVIPFLIILSTFESYDMEEKMSFEERVRHNNFEPVARNDRGQGRFREIFI